MAVYLDGNSLTLDDLAKIVYKFEKVQLTEESKEKVQKCRDYVEKIIAENNIKLKISLASELFYCDQINSWLKEPWATFDGNGKYFLFRKS